MTNWPHDVPPKSLDDISLEEIEDMILPNNLTALDVPGLPVAESKSPTKYAVDYCLTDEDGQIIEGTDHFIMAEFAWDRLEELAKLSGLDGTLTIRKL
jgi:hypothetical protein